MHLRPGCAGFRPDLQGDGAGELRPGRSLDAGRVHLLHVRGLVRRGLLGGARAGRCDRRALRRGPRRRGVAPGHRTAAVRRRHAHDRTRRRVPELRVDHVGFRDLHAPHAVQRESHARGRRDGEPRIRLDHHRDGRPVRPALRLLHVHARGRGDAGGVAEPARRLLHGHSGQADVLAHLGHLGRRGRYRRRAARAGVPHRHQPRLHRAQGVRGGGAGRVRLDSGVARGRRHHRAHRAVRRRVSAARVQGRRRLRRAPHRARDPPAGDVRHRGPEEGLTVRFVFKTSYVQDLGLFRDGVQRNWYIALLVLALVLPRLVPAYLGDIALVFIYGLCGLSLMVLAGYTGLVSLGHAAFLGIGAYTHVYLVQDLGLPWIVAVGLAAVVSAAAGVIVGVPALRMTGVYLTIATLAFAVIIQEIFTQWDRVTGGLKGKAVDKVVAFGLPLGGDVAFYFLCLAFLVGGLWLTANLLRSPTGRAWVAIRDSEIAAQSMGVHLAKYKTMAFSYSAMLMGVAGALFAHKIGFLAPDIFTVLLSIQFLLMVVVGGLGSLHGALFGAVFVAMLPVAISQARDAVPAWIAQLAGVFGTGAGHATFLAVDRFVKQPGLEPGIFGLILALVILFEPLGIYGRWSKIKVYFSLFPLYKHATFRRQRAYMRSERLR